jgi:hypothetical protein
MEKILFWYSVPFPFSLVVLFKAVFGTLAMHNNNCLTNTAKGKLKEIPPPILLG